MDLLTPDPGLMFWTIITFIVLLFILRKIAWGPIVRSLEEREKRIRDSLESADTARREAQRFLEEQKKLLSEARSESQKIVDIAKSAAENTRQELLQQAKAEAEHTLAAAKQEIEQSRDRALKEIRQVTADVALDVAAKIIGRSLDAEDHTQLIAESLQEIDRLS